MRLIRFFSGTFKGNYEGEGVEGEIIRDHTGSRSFHRREQTNKIIQIPVEMLK